MSLRTALLRQRLPTASPSRIISIRAVSSTPRRRAGHDDGHGGGHAPEEVEPDVYHQSSFPSPFYRNSLLLLTLLTLSSPYWPSTPKTPTSPTLTPDAFNSLRSDPSAPWLTRVIARFTTDGSVWNDRNDRHLALVMDAAEQRLLFQEAEKPKVWRIRNTNAFEQASPHSIPVGGQVDLSDLHIKRS